MHRLMLALALTASLLAPWSVPTASAQNGPCLNSPPREIPQISMANEPGGVRVVMTTQTQTIHDIDANFSTRKNANPQAVSYHGTTANFFIAIPNGGAPWFLAFNGCSGPYGLGGHWYTFVGHG